MKRSKIYDIGIVILLLVVVVLTYSDPSTSSIARLDIYTLLLLYLFAVSILFSGIYARIDEAKAEILKAIKAARPSAEEKE